MRGINVQCLKCGAKTQKFRLLLDLDAKCRNCGGSIRTNVKSISGIFFVVTTALGAGFASFHDSPLYIIGGSVLFIFASFCVAVYFWGRALRSGEHE
jgi:uncharacterized protein (DUF983 family)